MKMELKLFHPNSKNDNCLSYLLFFNLRSFQVGWTSVDVLMIVSKTNVLHLTVRFHTVLWNTSLVRKLYIPFHIIVRKITNRHQGALKPTCDNRKLHFEFNPRTMVSPTKKALKQISDIWLKFGNWVWPRTFQHPS